LTGCKVHPTARASSGSIGGPGNVTYLSASFPEINSFVSSTPM
jgi:hypothetical protein